MAIGGYLGSLAFATVYFAEGFVHLLLIGLLLALWELCRCPHSPLWRLMKDIIAAWGQ